MTTLNSVSLGTNVGTNANASGFEVPDSRRLLYVEDWSLARVSYGGGGLGDCALGAGYSLDGGATWAQLLPPGPTLGLSGTALTSTWTDVSHLAWNGDLLINAMAYGVTLLHLGLYSIKWIDLQVR